MGNNNKKFLVDYYSGLYNYYRTIHNHKEVLAWSGLVLFVLFGTIVTKVHSSDPMSGCEKILLSFGILFVAVIINIFVHIQLKLRDEGAYFAHAALTLLNEILQKEDIKNINHYLEIEEASTKENETSKRILPKILNDRFEEEEKKRGKKKELPKLLATYLFGY